MLDALLLLVAFAGGPTPSDTILDLRPGDRVVIEGMSGELSVVAWDREQLQVDTDEDDRGLSVERSGSTLRVFGQRRRGVDASVRVPSWVDLEIGGPDLEVSVEGLEGNLRVRNVRGDVRVRDARGSVEIRSVQGEIWVDGASAAVSVTTQSGDVTLQNVDAESLIAETLDGDVSFSGTLRAGGTYEVSVHDGDADLALPESTSARVSVSTFDGEFEADFPVVVQGFSGGREFEFVMGSGSARMRIEVFDGEIRLRRR